MTDRGLELEWIGLAEAITQLRNELEAARSAGAGSGVKFRVSQVELEFTAELRRSGEANAGLRWAIVSAGVKGTKASVASHRLKLLLLPQEEGLPQEGGGVSSETGTLRVQSNSGPVEPYQGLPWPSPPVGPLDG